MTDALVYGYCKECDGFLYAGQPARYVMPLEGEAPLIAGSPVRSPWSGPYHVSCADKKARESTPAKQIEFGLDYIKEKYGHIPAAAELLDQDAIWIDNQHRIWRLEDMEPDHLDNLVAWLDRYARRLMEKHGELHDTPGHYYDMLYGYPAHWMKCRLLYSKLLSIQKARAEEGKAPEPEPKLEKLTLKDLNRLLLAVQAVNTANYPDEAVTAFGKRKYEALENKLSRMITAKKARRK